jgi:peptidoglycan/LPS O-acetylase OafA/YrhL
MPRLTPPQYLGAHSYARFWTSIGAVYLLFDLLHAPSLRVLLAGSFMQYLGRISYALYLVHGPVLRGLGVPISRTVAALVGQQTSVQLGLASVPSWPCRSSWR